MLKIRLQRVGRKHEPTFRVVVTDSKNSTKSGRFLEVLGSYDPRKHTESFDGEKIRVRMAQGAKLSGTLHNLLVSKKIIEGKKINVLPRKSPIKKDTPTNEVEVKSAPTGNVVATPTSESVGESVADEASVEDNAVTTIETQTEADDELMPQEEEAAEIEAEEPDE